MSYQQSQEVVSFSVQIRGFHDIRVYSGKWTEPFKLFCRSDEPVVETSEVESRLEVETDHVATFPFTVESSSRPVDEDVLLSVRKNQDFENLVVI